MPATVISRASWTDDDGTGTTGTILQNARLQADIYDKIDALFSGAATFEFGGALKIDGVLDVVGYKETKTDLTVTSNTISINMALGSLFNFQATANITTTTITNIPATGRFASMILRVKGDGTVRTWTWFDSTVKWGGSVAPTRTSTTNKYDWYLFTTVDAGTTWSGFVMSQNGDN